MVLKLFHPTLLFWLLFENDVKMYGTQTPCHRIHDGEWFENDVKMYGTQTTFCSHRTYNQFENDVKMYGTQTEICTKGWKSSLRMM